MIKIMLTVRNRLEITKKTIMSLKEHSKLPHQLFVYNNLTDYRVVDHHEYFCKLYAKGLITQVTYNTRDSTFNAFSKAAACNQFGRLHEEDPAKDNFDFLVFLDNDVVVTPGWDKMLSKAWSDVRMHKMKNVKVIGQLPGGIKQKTLVQHKIAEVEAKVGKLGGSGLWSIRPNFFTDVGYIDIKRLVGHNKKHDQEYWRLMDVSTNGKPYILGLQHKLGIHCGPTSGSICNVLTSNRGKKGKDLKERIKFEAQDSKISSMNFDEFYKWIIDTKSFDHNW